MGQLNTIVPDKEPERQYYFIELLKDEIKKKAEKKGGSLTYHIQTFGCQMNARDSENLRVYWKQRVLSTQTMKKLILLYITPAL